MRRSLRLTTAPAAEPITTAEAKSYLRVDHSDDDTIIDVFVAAARGACEDYTNRALINQSWTMFMDTFGGGAGQGVPAYEGIHDGAWIERNVSWIELPKSPVVSLTSFEYIDNADAETAVPVASYITDTANEPGRLTLRTGSTWPTETIRSANGVKVVFVAGYGTAGSDLPANLRIGIYKMLAYLYENRDVPWEGNALPMDVEALWRPFRVNTL
jgi:hypothetical protein